VTREQGRLASRAGGGALPPLSWSALHPSLRRLVLAAGGLTLASVPDAFFAIWLCAHGVKPTWVPAAWAGGCAVRALVAWPAGHLSDLRGRLPVMVLAWTARAVLLAALPWIASLPVAVAAYLVYCATTASTEGAERALVGDAASPREKGTAFGLYYLVVGLVALPGAWVFGLLWQRVSEHAAFTASAALTLLCALLFAWTARAERTGGGEAALPS
jgi:predicted MFS family arabinose efflux permease